MNYFMKMPHQGITAFGINVDEQKSKCAEEPIPMCGVPSPCSTKDISMP